MSKITAILGSALFFVVAPAMLAGVIPWLITHWEFRPPFLAAEATRLAGRAFNPFWGICDHGAFFQHRRRRQKRCGRIPCRRTA
jgi:hypothetical protein